MSFDVAAFCSLLVMPAARCKCKLPLYSPVLVRWGQEVVEQQCGKKPLERRLSSPAVVHLIQGCVGVRVCWPVSHWQLQQKGQWPDSLSSTYTTAHLMGLNRNPVVVLLAHNQQWYPCLIHRKGKGKPPLSLLCKGWNRLNPLGLNNLQKSPSYGNGCFHIFVLETAAASHRVWVSVLVLAVHTGSKSQA